MSKLDESRELITSRVRNALASSIYNGKPFSYPNQPFSQPKNEMWGKLSILGGEAIQADLGPTPTDRHIGIVQFDVLVPEDTGTKLGNDFGEFLGNIFKRKNYLAGASNSLVFRVPNYSWVESPVAGLKRLIVRIDFKRDEKN